MSHILGGTDTQAVACQSSLSVHHELSACNKISYLLAFPVNNSLNIVKFQLVELLDPVSLPFLLLKIVPLSQTGSLLQTRLAV